MTKSELQEHLIELQAAFRQERIRNRSLLRENKQLSSALKLETERFEKLFGYVKSLREWVCNAKR